MVNSDQRKEVNRGATIIRKLIRLIQILPFLYLILYAAVLLSEPFESGWLFDTICTIAYVPVSGTIVFLLLSRRLGLCAWHKVACLLPISSRVTDFVDNYVLQFTQTEVIVINTIIGIICIAFVILAVKHFSYGR